MTDSEFGDIVLVPFPFTDQSTVKKRPAVVVSSKKYNRERPDVIVMAVTSHVRFSKASGEVTVAQWKEAGLLKPSVLKPLLATIERGLVLRKLGRLQTTDRPPFARHCTGNDHGGLGATIRMPSRSPGRAPCRNAPPSASPISGPITSSPASFTPSRSPASPCPTRPTTATRTTSASWFASSSDSSRPWGPNASPRSSAERGCSSRRRPSVACCGSREPRGPEPVVEIIGRRKVAARRPGDAWHLDLTAVPLRAGMWVPWRPSSLPPRWPFCWTVGVIVDEVSRAIVGFAVFKKPPTAKGIQCFLERAIRASGNTPRFLVTDRGTQFDCKSYHTWCKQRGIKARFGNQWRPHTHLAGRTPQEVYEGRPAHRLRFEPRPRWRLDRALERTERFELVVGYVAGRKHLPTIELRRAA